MSSKPLLIVGLQKTGTSLVKRVLEGSSGISSPFQGEGLDFWGDEPPFSPQGHPTGVLYQASEGRRGHRLDASDARPEIVQELQERWRLTTEGTAVALNKNPYNTVRLPFLRTVFPEARIVAVIRRPVPTVYSLLKKFTPHKGRGRAPEEGWWGVKPEGWHSLASTELVQQLSAQWLAVHELLLAELACVDRLVPYDAFCRDPGAWASRIVSGLGIEGPWMAIPALKSCDEEALSGSRLRSKNRYYRERGDLSLPDGESVELAPLSLEDRMNVEAATEGLWARLLDQVDQLG